MHHAHRLQLPWDCVLLVTNLQSMASFRRRFSFRLIDVGVWNHSLFISAPSSSNPRFPSWLCLRSPEFRPKSLNSAVTSAIPVRRVISCNASRSSVWISMRRIVSGNQLVQDLHQSNKIELSPERVQKDKAHEATECKLITKNTLLHGNP